MLKALGAVLFILGLIFSLTCWASKKYEMLLIQILLGPVFIAAGWQMMK
jgi:uncharacterized membrane protein HdeD (DUF308 family)